MGPFFALNAVSEKRPDITDTDLNLRFGWMLWSPGGSGVLRGNVEFLADVFGAGIVEGPGNVMAGGTLLLRYNFVQPDAKWTPYIQIGAGGLYNDVYESRPQRVLGRAFEFDLQAGVGLRYFVSDTCAVFIEADFRHISNANSAARNLGLNSVGGLIGGSYFF